MSCSPSDNTINVTPSPPIPLPGFGIPFSPPQIPLPTFDLPANLLEDFTALVNSLKALFPSGTFFPNPDFGMRTVLDFIGNVLSQLAPFLSFYKFIIALLKIVTCIIEVICAIPNPFALVIKIKKLFTECIPAFLALFPFLALILMIIALLLLILALIEYIITTIIAIIELLIANLLRLIDSIELQDVMGILAITQKIASLLCFLQNLMAILIAIAAIMAIIQSLMLIGGFTLCGPDSDCCNDAICPDFIKTTPNGIKTTVGMMYYNKELGSDVTALSLPPALASVFPSLRAERWQITDTNLLAQFSISLIITPSSAGNIFWPDPLSFNATTTKQTAPYTVDIRLEFDPDSITPNEFMPTSDGKGKRFFNIKNCIVVHKPIIGILDYQNKTILTTITGTLEVEGGQVFEDDGSVYNVTDPLTGKKQQATLNTFIHQNAVDSTEFENDTVTFENIEFTWTPNVASLAGYNLTTIGCVPIVNLESTVQNAALVAEGIDPVIVKVPVLPDVLGAQKCVSDALAALRKDVSMSGIATFQAAAITCMEDLRTQTASSLCNAIIQAASPFKSTIALDNDVQFTTRPITVTVVLNDPSATSVSNNIPATCVPVIEADLKGTVSFGKISGFKYDGSTSFKAEITSQSPGDGTVGVSFNGKDFSNMIIGTATTNSSIVENLVGYQFVDASFAPPVRRDEADVAVDGKA